ncbi:MAG: heme lyase CcmF/NrfE family subunit [Gammaproteobacteria bacterium]|nr:heme lyase CcmF/NrfE family subunit [Gammaproteobacteria bacterium]
MTLLPEVGHFALILALCMALVQSILPLVGAARHIGNFVAIARPAAGLQVLFVVIAYACLTQSFIVSDFSVAYVAQNSNVDLPLMYRISGVWGAHEGSLLLWVLILSLWTGAVCLFSRSVPPVMAARVIAVMGLVSVGFLLFLLLTSNPFERLFPIPLSGRDLNPLLQDPGLAIHPPMLYVGYVGFSVAFAFAVAALMGGRLDSAWARWSRPWTLVAWVFLTVGIALGSWWAYYELGWGGWWFWDPVENASFMPWLAGTALIHSLAATENRGIFKAWTVLLAVFAFSLSLLGTFLVRSGVLTSVHAFATDPTRGVFILVFLGVVVGGSLLLYAWRAPRIRSLGGFSLVSREGGLLFNNVLLSVATATVLLGTLYPLVIDALGLGKVSVGPPYFNSVFIPITAPLALVLGIGAMARWRKDSLARLLTPLRWLALAAVAGAVALAASFYDLRWEAIAGIALGLWVTASTGFGIWRRVAGHGGLARVPLAFWGMSTAHLGVGVFAVGIALTSTFSAEEDVGLDPGTSHQMAGYTFRFDGVRDASGPNYTARAGTVTAFLGDRQVAVMHPQKRVYRVQRNPMTEAAIDAGLFRDLYVALGDPLNDKGSWSLRLYYKPFVRWIWLGALFMAFGGILSACDRRYRRVASRVRQGAQTTAAAGA